MPVNKPIEFDVVVILSEWTDQDFGDLEPTDVEAKLYKNNIKIIRKFPPRSPRYRDNSMNDKLIYSKTILK